MEYAKDEFFQIKYNTKLNRLQIKGESWTSRFCKKIKSHKFITTVISAFFIFSIVNFIMINSFFNILENL